jgi:hypothetical protein
VPALIIDGCSQARGILLTRICCIGGTAPGYNDDNAATAQPRKVGPLPGSETEMQSAFGQFAEDLQAVGWWDSLWPFFDDWSCTRTASASEATSSNHEGSISHLPILWRALVQIGRHPSCAGWNTVTPGPRAREIQGVNDDRQALYECGAELVCAHGHQAKLLNPEQRVNLRSTLVEVLNEIGNNSKFTCVNAVNNCQHFVFRCNFAFRNVGTWF